MNRLIAIVVYALSLYGVDLGGSTFDLRPAMADAGTLHGRVVMYPGLMRFECLRSSSGRCHYTVYPRSRCPAPVETMSTDSMGARGHAGRCGLWQFSLPGGSSRQVLSLRAFDVCISVDPASPQRDCTAPNALASR